MADPRPPHYEIYMEVCHVLSKRSTCTRGHVGSILIRDRRIVATGYNGAPPHLPHCIDVGCDVPPDNEDAGCQRAVHAEANVIAFAARTGQGTEGSDLYCTHGPCFRCAQLIVCAGIERVVFEIPYRLPEGLDLLADAGVAFTRL